MLNIKLLILLGLLTLQSVAWGQADVSQADFMGNILDSIIETGASIFFLIIGLSAIAWGIRYYFRTYVWKSIHMQVVSHLPLSGKEKLILVKVDKINILLGVSPGNIQPIHTFEELTAPIAEQNEESLLDKINTAIQKIQKIQ